MKNLGIVITDGVGFRNYILTEFIEEAKSNFDNVIIFSCLPKSVYDDLNLKCEIIELDVFTEKFKNWFFRKAKEVAHLQLNKNNNFGIQDNFNSNKTKSKSNRGYATRFIIKFTSLFHSEKWILRYNYWQQNSFKNNKVTKQYEELLKDNKITLLFFTHQRPPFIAPLIFVAQKQNIKTATFIFSWDNLASKGRMAGNFDNYLVWSNLMKTELLTFYKSVKQHQVEVVGTPQFEPFTYAKVGYAKESLIKKFNLDSKKPIVFFTCNDSSSENDPIYLDLLANFIQTNKLKKEVNLIVRTSPAEDPDRFKEIAEKYEFIKWNFPDWTITRYGHQEAWTQRVPSVQDLDDLKTLLQHCEFNINVLSTITLDAFIFDKPVINPVFGNTINCMFDDQKFLKYEHLRKLVDSKASEIVTNEESFLNAINKILSDGDDKSRERKDFNNLQIGKPLEGTSKRIATILRKWSQEK
ncbi:hypothetical protein J3S90_01670 [Flavobacterium sp. P4023]|uniref:CDP-Glycerol:Poly(Glycerophosphate) glycerophosphotransferase n=1 Tax=Flavobacterium flabelliforme TaxID=2816119 RepID=A0ABS5CPF1_9FLAO|nr:hypothetical protein [Flavobacterium flabelliforme]MBP4140506.1 hypothetical protein [Flavobacterium flabelliforme]